MNGTSTSNIAEQLAGLSSSQRALLELRLMQKGRRASRERQAIKNLVEPTSAPLSYNQQDLWITNQLMPGSALYHTPTAARLTGKLDVEALKKSLNEIVARHAALRTTFKATDGTAMQVVNDFSLYIPLIDLSARAEREREAEALKLLREEARRPFDLSQGPLIRAVLLQLREDEHILLVTMHHIVTDGWSIGIFHRELSELYACFVKDRPSPLAKLPIQYTDYALWQRQYLEGEVYESQLNYWKKQFATLPAAIELPTDNQRPSEHSYRAFRGASHTLNLSKELTRDLKLL